MRWLKNECKVIGINLSNVIVKIVRILWWDTGLQTDWLN